MTLILKPKGCQLHSMQLTHERLLELFSYDRETGVFTRRIATGYRGRFRVGEVAGSLDKDSGYVRISVDGMHYWAHRLAWFYVHAEWAPNDVDHKDQIRDHNWIGNLRSVTRAENLQNQRYALKRSKSGVRGVRWNESKHKWQVDISVLNKTKYIGRFDDFEEAKAARSEAVRKHHPGALP